MSCPPLPRELWGEIFQYLGGFTVWVQCRRVSRMLRAEAERNFTTERLPNLHLGCAYVFDYDALDTYFTFRLFSERKSFQLSDCDHKATLDVKVSLHEEDFFHFTTDVPRGAMEQVIRKEELERKLKKHVWKALGCARDNLHLPCRDNSEEVLAKTQLGCSFNIINIPDLEIIWGSNDSNNKYHITVSFDWRELLNRLFAEEALMRSLRPRDPTQFSITTEEDAEEAFKCAKQVGYVHHKLYGRRVHARRRWAHITRFIEVHCKDEEELWQQAYMTRVRQSLMRNGTKLDDCVGWVVEGEYQTPVDLIRGQVQALLYQREGEMCYQTLKP